MSTCQIKMITFIYSLSHNHIASVFYFPICLHCEVRKTVHVALLDLEKAFDKVPHELIWYSLRQHLVPEVYIDWIRQMYSHPSSVVRCPAGLSKPFRITTGVHQGSALSPLLFILVMNTIGNGLIKPPP